AVDSLPQSLKDAVSTFLLSCAIRDLREEPLKHRSMLVNVSRFADVQGRIAESIEGHLYSVLNDVRQYLSADDLWPKHPVLADLR
ncbi:Z1 domain-containing protein, partial [Stenotrophomonas maltophilia]